MFWARVLADVLVVFHACYALFVVLGLGVILVGVARGWAWVRNPWFRLAHLAAIGYVVLEEVLRWPCPLTVWEKELRSLGGEQAYAADFLGHWAHRLLFFDFPPMVFTLAYLLFGAVVALTFLLAPPRWPGRARTSPDLEPSGPG
ncbi:MAG: DUF2784 domain-containing protein [Isosphaeraceae bacterium]